MNASDFGVMLAWTELVDRRAGESEASVVVCDDPWLFRHLAKRPGILSGTAPGLWTRVILYAVRGFLARCKAAAGVVGSLIATRRHRSKHPLSCTAMLVYGHPESDAAGADGYFGDMMSRHPEITRILHVDCPSERAEALSADGRTFSLHAWGSILGALTLPFSRWRPTREQKRGGFGWLIRRAAALEGGTGQPAMIRWQQICQRAWLHATSPKSVVWPWENHAWEREFVREARTGGTKTVGYQHATIGKWEINYSSAANPDGLRSVPDTILASGPASEQILLELGYPAERVSVGGARRFDPAPSVRLDRQGPVLVALPFDRDIAHEMVEAVRPLGRNGRRILVKDHPMTPFKFTPGPGVTPTDEPLAKQGGLSAVVYAATTVGLEAVLAGLPTFRFRPACKLAPDILPKHIVVPVVTADSLEIAIDTAAAKISVQTQSVFSLPDEDTWRAALSVGKA